MADNGVISVPIPISAIDRPRYSSRLQELSDFFLQVYHVEPEFFVRVPGRVNIIGEHVDYCGYPVLPMAIEQSILLAVATDDSGLLHLRNIDPKYDHFKCDLNSFKIELSSSGGPNWYSYFLCGVRGIIEHLGGDILKSGMSIAISGNVPPASGLSSSSALVSSAALATAAVFKMPLDAQALANISANCERYIGTQGGGMDQAIAFLGKKGCAQFIEFHPSLNAESVTLPKTAHFVVANSLTEINKAATSDFNERVVECRTACRILAKKFDFTNWKDIIRFAELQTALGCKLEELEQLADQVLSKDVYTREDILEELSVSEEELYSDFLTPNTKHMKLFKLRQRALHVLQESIRVLKFRQICNGKNCSVEPLSELMNQSHDSLKLLYECSHPNLDKLVEISREMGIGARLTGAGWGGCIVALCDSMEQSYAYIEKLKKTYYENLPQAKDKDLDNIIFATCPQNGAEIFIPIQSK